MTKLKRTNHRKIWIAMAITAAGLATGVMAAPGGGVATVLDALGARSVDARDVLRALKLRLPKTKVDAVNCTAIAGLCEVSAGGTLFYVDNSARYLMVGRIYDMETRQDLTAARLLALNPDLLAAGAARNTPAPDDEAQAPAAPAKPAHLSLEGLRANGAIEWGPAQGARVIILSDFQCSYCKKLEGELTRIGARVAEHPISIFGKVSRNLAEAVLCASNPQEALKAAYRGEPVSKARRCDTSGLDANEAFAKAHGFSGTPVIIRPDGAVLEGYRPAQSLVQFLKYDAQAFQIKGN